jgi:hypothetical protein
MTTKQQKELEAAIEELTAEEKPAHQIKVKQAPSDNRVKVNFVPGHEQIIWTLRSLTDSDFREVIKAAKQYRKADKILDGMA